MLQGINNKAIRLY